MLGCTYSVVASGLHDADTVAAIIEPVEATLAALGGTQAEDPIADLERPHVIVVATGGTERPTLEVVRRRWEEVPWEPVVLLTHPLHNSLPAALETLARIHADGGRGHIIQTPDDEAVETALRDLGVLHRLRRARVGLVGTPSEWLVASVPDADHLQARWGIELVDVDIGSTIDEHRRVDPAAARPVAVRFEPDPNADTIAAAALHPALTRTIEDAEVDAIAVRCFDFITELETSGCVALAELNDAGFVAGCEGDVAATVAMLLARWLLDEPGWVANPAVIDPVDNTLLLAHCTVAPSMVEEIELHTHFESGLGIGIRGRFAPGGVTLLRLGGPSLEHHWFAEADVTGTGDSPDLCRTQVQLAVEDQAVGELLDAPLGNHLVMVRGRHRERLERWWSLAFP